MTSFFLSPLFLVLLVSPLYFGCTKTGGGDSHSRLPAPPAQFQAELKRAGYVLKTPVFITCLKEGEKTRFTTLIRAREECRCAPGNKTTAIKDVCRGCFKFVAEASDPMQLRLSVDDVTDIHNIDVDIAQSEVSTRIATAGVCWDWDCDLHVRYKKVQLRVTAVKGSGKVRTAGFRLSTKP
ncbi:hypothetical protein KKF84_18500 [Myxococcota bacterium]|nr:hypothetical protein [Myxococcota bacterium]MBU1537312.1 hypothetical protein [Myxococcota bacterium]